jgi:hypothetical protein
LVHKIGQHKDPEMERSGECFYQAVQVQYGYYNLQNQFVQSEKKKKDKESIKEYA